MRFLSATRRQPDDAVKAKAAELVQGKTDDMEKVKALYDYVSRNIRYVSLSFGLGRIQPHAASEVLANGYGDCKDKNTLLAALLQSQGIESSSVLIGVERKLDPDVPSPSQFDHVITRVPVGGTGDLARQHQRRAAVSHADGSDARQAGAADLARRKVGPGADSCRSCLSRLSIRLTSIASLERNRQADRANLRQYARRPRSWLPLCPAPDAREPLEGPVRQYAATRGNEGGGDQ